MPVDVADGAAVVLAGAIGAGVAGAAVGVAGFIALVVLLAAGPPQAIPRALRPKTVESTNTFVILLRLLSFSKNIKNPVSRVRLMKHNRFVLNSFFFKTNERIEIREDFVNLKSIKNHLFLNYFLQEFSRFIECQ